MQQIIIYTPMPRSQRFKIYIPYNLKDERIWLKSQNTAFYHPQQRLWSLVNTPENKKLVAGQFKGKYTVQTNENQILKQKPIALNEKICEALAKCEQKFILKSFSQSTIKNYLGALTYFFSFYKDKVFEEIKKT